MLARTTSALRRALLGPAALLAGCGGAEERIEQATVISFEPGACSDGVGPGGHGGMSCDRGRCELVGRDGERELRFAFTTRGAGPEDSGGASGSACPIGSMLDVVVVHEWGPLGTGAEARIVRVVGMHEAVSPVGGR